MKKAAIIHGTKGSPSGNWFPWISGELTKRGYETFVPTMPTPDNQNLGAWLRAFDLQVGELDSDSIVIGHSAGAVFTLRLLERVKRPIAVAGIIAGFTAALGLPEYDALNASFVSKPFDWAKIRENSRSFICMAGDADPYVPTAQATEIADSLDQELIIVAGGGHLNSEFGFSQFPQLLQALQNLKLWSESTAPK